MKISRRVIPDLLLHISSKVVIAHYRCLHLIVKTKVGTDGKTTKVLVDARSQSSRVARKDLSS